ncbi:MAG: DUF5615 family PIN-like protein [Bryobacteraceae bacterium]
MALFYSNEDVALQVVLELRRLGHDVLTTLDAAKGRSALPDAEILAFATAEGRILLSHNRRQFLHLHRYRTDGHAGIVLCTFDTDFAGLAQRVHASVATMSDMKDRLIRLNRPVR